jgi:hypothetical protein
MTDRELLELAAKAAGIRVHVVEPSKAIGGVKSLLFLEADENGALTAPWNPLEDDGPALRLAVKLGIAIQLHPSWVYARAVPPNDPYGWREITEGWGNTKDPLAATRRAIVRAAASIGSGKP